MTWSAEKFNAEQTGYLAGELGIEWTHAEHGLVQGRMTVTRKHLASTGYLHAAAVVALADTAAGYGCLAALPADALGFTTAELKANYIGTAREGSVSCEARLAHAGRTTQVWDATVRAGDSGKTIALFRCTQIVLYGTAPTSRMAPADVHASRQR